MAGLVVEKRRYPRVNLAASGLLVYRNDAYHARLENISLGGALVTLYSSDYLDISQGERCSLSLYPDEDDRELSLTSRMVHLGDDMVCVRFVDLDQDTRLTLRSLIAHQLSERPRVTPKSSLCSG